MNQQDTIVIPREVYRQLDTDAKLSALILRKQNRLKIIDEQTLFGLENENQY